MKKLLVADGTNIMFRSFYGIRPFTTKSGLHTNAVYGFTTMLTKHIEELTPDAVAVAFDLPEPTFRHKKFDAYKGTRQKAPEELTEQIEYVRRCADALGLHPIAVPGYEADDILGTLARMGEEEDCEVYVLSGDRDTLQLITNKTSVVYLTSKENILYDEAKFFENYGTEPKRLVDIKALMGDTSDNIPGVRGIGEKTAKKLISENGSLDAVYADLDSLAATASVKEKLRAGREAAYMSAELATITRFVPLEVKLDELDYTGYDAEKLAALFSELEFYKLSERFGLNASDNGSIDKSGNTVKIAAEVQSARKLTSDALINAESVTAWLDGNDIYIAADGSDEIYVTEASSAEAKEIFSRASVTTHGSKKLYSRLASYGVTPKLSFDTELAAYVLRSGESSYDIERLMLTYLGEGNAPVRGEELVLAVGRLAEAERKLLKKASDEARARGIATSEELLYDIELPLVPVLAEMEAVGFHIDINGVLEYAKMLGKAEQTLAEQIYFRAGHEFNINSPKQLGTVLFDEMGLPAGKKTKTGYSTNAETLENLRYSYEIADDILNYRQIAKLRGTYGESLAAMADENGCIHSTFNQTVTATGRLSSTDPNLQNIPVRTELGRELRRFFVPSAEDRVLVDADYSQIELRLLAAVSDDETMKHAFISGADIHASTASEVFGVPMEQVTGELRSRAKAVNFGIVYGIGDYSLSRDIGTTRKEAAQYIENYLSTYKKVDEYLKNAVSEAKEHGYVTTLFGRRRYIPEINVSNKQTRAFGERVAMNSPIQGTAADIIKLAMINTSRALKREGLDAKLILQVHDELIVDSSKKDAEAVKALLVREMENAVKLSVPLSVEANVGDSWYECK